MFILFTFQHYYFFEKLKIVEKQLCKVNYSYGKVSQTLNLTIFNMMQSVVVKMYVYQHVLYAV